MTYLDTHALIWLNPGEAAGLSDRARRAIDADDELLLSPMVLLELENLHEIRRFRFSSSRWLGLALLQSRLELHSLARVSENE